jgi:hypothetical protein
VEVWLHTLVSLDREFKQAAVFRSFYILREISVNCDYLPYLPKILDPATAFPSVIRTRDGPTQPSVNAIGQCHRLMLNEVLMTGRKRHGKRMSIAANISCVETNSILTGSQNSDKFDNRVKDRRYPLTANLTALASYHRFTG